MRVFAAAGLLVAVVVVSPSVDADDSTPTTNWTFRVSYSTGQFSENHDAAASTSVLMYTGASWRCSRNPVSLTNQGKLLGGYLCSQPQGTAQVFITVGCAPSSEDVDHAEATISDTTTSAFMRFSVVCSTTRSTRAATRPQTSIEKNL